MCTFKITKDFEHYNNFTYDNQKLITPEQEMRNEVHPSSSWKEGYQEANVPASKAPQGWGHSERKNPETKSHRKNQCSSPGPILEEGAAGTFPRE